MVVPNPLLQFHGLEGNRNRSSLHVVCRTHLNFGGDVAKAMDKLQKIRGLEARTRNFARMISALFALALFALAAAIFAASTAQMDVPSFPGFGSRPTTPATYPEFTIVPGLPRVQLTSGQLYTGQFHNFKTWYRGVASWYGPAFNGRLTANGEVYDMYAMTAATSESSPRLPLGTRVRVVNTHNGRAVVVRITDRGPLPDGRILDLSYGAARKLAMVRPGIVQVRVHVLRWGRDHYHATSKS